MRRADPAAHGPSIVVAHETPGLPWTPSLKPRAAKCQLPTRVLLQSSWTDLAAAAAPVPAGGNGTGDTSRGGGSGGSGRQLVFHVGPVPHEWLFQHVAAVVHHGGAGTVAAG